MRIQTHPVRRFEKIVIVTFAAFLLGPLGRLAIATEQKAFPTPNAAMSALIVAVKSHSTNDVLTILGPELQAFNATRDKSLDDIDREIFLDNSTIVKIEKQGSDPNTVIAYLGNEEWPFPAPLVKTASGWKFDGKAGLEEILDRQIGRTEIAAIRTCSIYVDVQLEYFSQDRLGDGYLQFAQKINSTPGKFDGLYWSNANGEDVSPVGPFAAQAAGTEIGPTNKAVPHFGYYFKILTAQGDAAPGGAHSYLVNGRMLGGFALVAWPAEHGATGVATFIVNHLGAVYQKDLGPETHRLARAIHEYNPDSTWKQAE